MALKIPSGYIDLYHAPNRQNVDINVIGVVTDYLSPKQSRRTDWTCSFSIKDESNRGTGDGLKVRFFRPKEAELPAIKNIGDLVILRCIKAKEFGGMIPLMSNWSTTCVVFPKGSIPEKLPTNHYQLKHIKDARSPAPTLEEIQYVVSLYNTINISPVSVPTQPNESTTLAFRSNKVGSSVLRQRFSLVKDITFDTFYDLVGQVCKIYPSNDRCELYISDYTTNNQLYNHERDCNTNGEDAMDGDPYHHIPPSTKKKWQGPWGKMTLKVMLWNPHSDFARSSIRENDFVHLRNVLARSFDGRLEGRLHTDRYYPDRVEITVLGDDDDRVKDVLRRKKDYKKRFNVEDNRPQKRKRDDGKLSKSQRRNRNKQQGQGRSGQDPISSNEKSTKFPKLLLNKNIACTNPDQPSRSLSFILSPESTHAYTTPDHQACILPFQNVKHRITVRVIDYFPGKLEDFAVRHRVTEYDVLEDESESERERESENEDGYVIIASDNSDRNRQKFRWEWRFGLILQDASSLSQKPEERDWIKVYVGNESAEFLLKMEAVDLRKDSTALSLLREKLFILWGDLEERKTNAKVQEVIAEENDKRALTEVHVNNQPITSPEGNEKSSDGKQQQKERSDQRLSSQNIAFQCSVMEYGVRVPKREIEPVGGRGNQVQGGMKQEMEAREGNEVGSEDQDEKGDETETETESEMEWQRCFQIFGTTIK